MEEEDGHLSLGCKAAQRDWRPKTQQQPPETAPTSAAVGPGGPRRQAAARRGDARRQLSSLRGVWQDKKATQEEAR